jgi:hypothetical protein
MVGFDVSRPHHQLMGLDSQPFRIQHRLQQERSNAGAINKPGLHGAIRMFAAMAAMLQCCQLHQLRWRPGRVQASRIGTAHEPDSVPGSRLALPWLSYLRVNALSYRFQHPLPPLPLHSTHSTHSTSQLLPSFTSSTRRVDVMTTHPPPAHFSTSISTSQYRILISMKLAHVMLDVHAANNSSFSSSP